MKYFGAFRKGPAYAEMLKTKMKAVETASQTMSERASQREQVRLKEIRNVTLRSTCLPAQLLSGIDIFQANDQVGELKVLAVEARNHLYAVLKDAEVWHEAIQSQHHPVYKIIIPLIMAGWKESRIAEESQRKSDKQAVVQEQSMIAPSAPGLSACTDINAW